MNIKQKFRELKQTILDIILIKLIEYNPNHCYRKEWESIEKKNKEYRTQGEKYFKEAESKYKELQPVRDLSYNQELNYKFKTDEVRYKTCLRLIVEENRLQEVKKDFESALKENRYVVKIGHHKSIELNLSTCKRLIDDIEAIYKEYGTTDYVKLFKYI